MKAPLETIKAVGKVINPDFKWDAMRLQFEDQGANITCTKNSSFICVSIHSFNERAITDTLDRINEAMKILIGEITNEQT